MTNQPIDDVVVCSLCGQERGVDHVRWFLPDAPAGDTLIMNWPETTRDDPEGVPCCAGCLAEQIADESEDVIG